MAARSSEIARSPEVAPVLALPAEAGRPATADLAGLDDLALLSLVQSLPLASQWRAAACELLVTRYQVLVRSCVRAYRGGPVPTEDLMQVGYYGLLKAISHFDPAAARQPGRLRAALHQRRAQAVLPRQALGAPRRPAGAGADPPGPRRDRAADPPAGPHPGRLRPGPAPGSQRGQGAAGPAGAAGLPAVLAGRAADRLRQPRSPWPTPSARRIPGSTTCSACTPSPPTGRAAPARAADPDHGLR